MAKQIPAERDYSLESTYHIHMVLLKYAEESFSKRILDKTYSLLTLRKLAGCPGSIEALNPRLTTNDIKKSRNREQDLGIEYEESALKYKSDVWCILWAGYLHRSSYSTVITFLLNNQNAAGFTDLII